MHDNAKMKITVVQGAFLPVPPLMGGAVEKVWFGLCPEFVRRGHEVTHISRCHDSLPRRDVIAGVKHLRIPGFDTPKSLLHLKLLDLIYSLRARRVLPQADILVTQTFWLPLLVRNGKTGKLYVHAQRYPKGQMRLYRHAARIQTVSSSVADAIKKQATSVAKIVRVIPNPLPDYLFENDAGPMDAERDKTILYVGRVHPEKGIELLIDAFRQFKSLDDEGWRLKIVGPWETRLGGGGQAYYDRLQSLCEPVSDLVDWVGPVFEPMRLLCHYRRAGIFVYPSLAAKGETFGVAPVEAMAAGCPVLVSDLECFRDYLEAGGNGLVFDQRAPKPEGELARSLRTLACSPGLRSELARRGIETAQRYRMGHIADLYLDDFRSLLP